MFIKILKKIISLIVTLFLLSLIIFTLIRFTSGNPAIIVLGGYSKNPSVEAILQVEKELGLDRNIFIQYFYWLKRILVFDFGNSFISKSPVIQEFLIRFPKTLYLAISSTVISILIAFPSAIYCSLKKESIFSKVIKLYVLIFASLPAFIISLAAIYIFSYKLKWFNIVYDNSIKGLILPSMVLALNFSTAYIIIFSKSLNTILTKDYILTAKMKGLKNYRIIIKHMIKNSIIPTITLIGMNFSSLLGGSFVVESIFSYPGIGKYAIDAIFLKDYPIIQAYVVILAFFIIVVNFFVDIIYFLIDPRTRLKQDEI